MKKILTYIKNSAAVTGLLAIMLVSCLKEPGAEVTMPSQLFRPIQFAGNVNVVDVTFGWAPIKDASYLLEVSRDSFQFERELRSIPIDGQREYLLKELRSQSRYSARIKAVSKKPAVRDSEYQMITFTTGLENIFYQPAPADISATTVELSWEAGKAVSHIEISSGKELVRSITLAEEHITMGHILIQELDPGKQYTFQIFNADILRGTISAQTLTK